MTKATGIGRGRGVPQRCPARHSDLGWCVLNAGPDAHEMACQSIGDLVQPLPIHHNEEGRMWTLLGPYPVPVRDTT